MLKVIGKREQLNPTLCHSHVAQRVLKRNSHASCDASSTLRAARNLSHIRIQTGALRPPRGTVIGDLASEIGFMSEISSDRRPIDALESIFA